MENEIAQLIKILPSSLQSCESHLTPIMCSPCMIIAALCAFFLLLDPEQLIPIALYSEGIFRSALHLFIITVRVVLSNNGVTTLL